MAKANSPLPFLNKPGEEPVRDFRAFEKEIREFFMLADVKEEKQTTWVSYCLGVQGKHQARHILSGITAETKVDDLLKDLSLIFQKTVSKMVARNVFGRRMQNTDETAMEFLSNLQALTVDCEFQPKVAEENVIDRFIIGLRGEFSELRGKLLADNELTIKRVKQMVSEFTVNREQTAALDAASRHAEFSCGAEVNNVRDSREKNANGTAGELVWRSRVPAPSHSRGPPFTGAARGKVTICFNCGKPGHIAAVCYRSTGQNNHSQLRGRPNGRHPRGYRGSSANVFHASAMDKSDSHAYHTSVTEKLDQPESGEYFGDDLSCYMIRAKANARDKVEVDVQINGLGWFHKSQTNSSEHRINESSTCTMLVDSGSRYTLIPRNVAEDLKIPIKDSTLKLGAYTGHRINVIGEMDAVMSYEGKEWPCSLVVVEDGPALLGLEEIRGLQVDILRICPVRDFPIHPVTGSTSNSGVADRVNTGAVETKACDRNAVRKAKDGGSGVSCKTESNVGSETAPKYGSKVTPKVASACVPMGDVCGPTNKIFQGVGRAVGFSHTIRLKPNAVPRVHKPRPVPLAMVDKHAENLKKLEELGIISSIKCSPWQSPFTCVFKKGTDKVRSTLDLRYLNSQVVERRYPLPNIEQFLSRFHGTEIFTTLDLSMAYHQLPLAPESRELTAFQTDRGLKNYNFVPFGLVDGASALQNFMEETLEQVQEKHRSLAVIAPYMDDIIVATKGGVQVHKMVVHDVLTAIFQAGLTLSYEKCKWGHHQVSFLGHVISAKGVAPGLANTKAILEAGRPQDQRQLKSYIGLVGFFSRFVYGWAGMVGPLYDVANKEKWEWTEQAEKAFIQSKQALADAANARLRFFRPGGETTLVCDASGDQICAILCQLDDDGVQQPIAFFSRRLKGRELNFSVGEKELLAVIEGSERNHHLLYGRRFRIVTDHKSLVSLLEPSSVLRVTQRMARWTARLLCYDFRISYVSTDANPADALTRLPQNSQELANRLDVAIEDDIVVSISVGVTDNGDEEQSELRRYIVNGWPINKTAVVDVDARAARQLERELWIDENNKVRRGADGIWVAPRSAWREILSLAHRGHPGRSRMKNLVRQWAWWPGMTVDVDVYCSKCEQCAVADKTHKSRDAHGLKSTPLPEHAWEILAMDVVGPFNFSPRYVVTLVDTFSRWPEIYMGDIPPTSETIKKFLTEVFGRFGNPKVLKTDGASIFQSRTMNEFLTIHGVNSHVTTAYNSRSNAHVERFNGFVCDVVQGARRSGSDVRGSLLEALASFRATPHSTTGVSPALLLLGREIRSDLAGFTGAALTRRVPTAAEIEAVTCARRGGDRYEHDVGTRYQVGESVMVKKPRNVAKGEARYEGPLKIVRFNGPVTAELDNGWIVNFRRLSRCSHNVTDHSSRSHSENPTNMWHPGSFDGQPETAPAPRRSERARRVPHRYGVDDFGGEP